MRYRFFFIILTTLIVAAVGINVIHASFFRTQRLNLIDRLIAESSNILLNSEEFNSLISDPEKVDDSITRVLQGLRIGKVFLVRDRSGEVVFQSGNTNLLNVELPVSPEWVSVRTPTEYIRLRNIPWPKNPQLTLQVGSVVDRNFIEWKIVDRRLVTFVIWMVLALFGSSVLLTVILLSPLRQVISHLQGATANLVNMRDVMPLPSRLTRHSGRFWTKSDEFYKLVRAVRRLIDRINLNYKLTRSWTFQMAHELKTPLAIVRADVDSARKAGDIPDHFARGIVDEVKNMTETIERFLEWAELESSEGPSHLHALHIEPSLKSVCSRLDKIAPGRIQLKSTEDFPIFANAQHFDQMLANLLTNAMKFSPQDSPVEVSLEGHSVRIRDRGAGIPLEVKERLGQPFNVGISINSKGKTGHGLGLAWVTTVAKLYQWDLQIESGESGTDVTVHFPAE